MLRTLSIVLAGDDGDTQGRGWRFRSQGLYQVDESKGAKCHAGGVRRLTAGLVLYIGRAN